MSSRRPLIGITSYVESASWAVWHDVRAALVPHAYVDHVIRAGGRPIVIPPVSSIPKEADQLDGLLEALDGLILTGGADVAAAQYGAEPHQLVQLPRHDRDASEIALAREAVELDLPLLGICRGMQVMSVAAGGHLEQHLPDVLGHEDHSPGPGVYGRHEVSVREGSLLQSIVGSSLDVASYHHQGVIEHPGYVGTARAADSTLEAMEHSECRFALGVQWHPEVDLDNRLFAALVDAARQ